MAVQAREAGRPSGAVTPSDRVALLRQADLLILYCNSLKSADYGLTPAELVGRTLFDVLPGDEAGELATALATLSPAHPSRRQVIAHQGRTIEWSDELLTGGEADTVLSIGRDVTEEDRLRDAHREVDARFRVAMGEAPIGMALVGLDGSILEVNPALCALVGREAHELLTLTTAEITHPEDVEIDRIYGEQLLVGRETPTAIEKRFLRPDGSVVWGLLKTSVVHDEAGQPSYLVGQVVDITERVDREAALARLTRDERAVARRLREIDELKDTFVSAVSHEMRTPLTAILGFAELLRDRRGAIPTDEIDRITGRMCRNAERLSQLVDDLLDLGPLARNDTPAPHLTEVDLAGIAGAVLEGFHVGDRRVLTDLAEVTVPLDPARIERALTGLLANATCHTPEGTTIWVAVDRDGDGARLTVADDGPGIADELKGSLFDPFVKGPSPAAKAGGSGIGLTMVARAAALHGGRAWITDRAGGGTAVHVWLPAARAE